MPDILGSVPVSDPRVAKNQERPSWAGNGCRERSVEVDLSSLIDDTKNIRVEDDGSLVLLPGSYANRLPEQTAFLTTQEAAIEAVRKYLDEIAAKNEKIIVEELARDDKAWISGGDAEPTFPLRAERLTQDPRVKARVKSVAEKIAAQKKAEIEEKTKKIAAQKPALDALEIASIEYAAGKREKPIYEWFKINADYERANKINNRIVEAEKELLQKAKTDQLTDVVSRLGTDLQKAKWETGVMAHKEALTLIWNEVYGAIPDGLPGNEYHLPEETSEYDEEIERDKTEKKTLTDEQFTKIQEIIKIVPDAEVSYWHEYYEDHDDMDSLDLVRLTKTVGQYTLSCDVIL